MFLELKKTLLEQEMFKEEEDIMDEILIDDEMDDEDEILVSESSVETFLKVLDDYELTSESVINELLEECDLLIESEETDNDKTPVADGDGTKSESKDAEKVEKETEGIKDNEAIDFGSESGEIKYESIFDLEDDDIVDELEEACKHNHECNEETLFDDEEEIDDMLDESYDYFLFI